MSAGTDHERREAWYHADFCHAYAWVYEEDDHLRVKWSERDGSNLYLHSHSDCARCAELARTKHAARYGEFTMAKPDAEFSSAEAFFTVLAEIAEYVPGLRDDDGAGEGSRPSSPVAPDGPESTSTTSPALRRGAPDSAPDSPGGGA